MSPDEPRDNPKDEQSKEVALEKLFVEITGENESQARSAFMFISRDKEEPPAQPQD